MFGLSVLDVDRLRLLLQVDLVVGYWAGDGLGYRSYATSLTMASMTIALGNFNLNHLKVIFAIGKLTQVVLLHAGFSPELLFLLGVNCC